MKALVTVRLKNGVLDPQGKAIHKALNRLSFSGVNDVKQGKLIEINLNGYEGDNVEGDVTRMCEELLVNTVIENYEVEIKN